jgi:hypothetical protein
VSIAKGSAKSDTKLEAKNHLVFDSPNAACAVGDIVDACFVLTDIKRHIKKMVYLFPISKV